jgi:RNA polymerase sigma-70 factor (ECF subfamily)
LTDSQISEIELWDAFKKGDKIAFGQLFSNYYTVLYQYGYKIIQDSNLLEDTIQELFIELWESRSSTVVRSVKAYLFRSLQYKLFKKIQQQRIVYTDNEGRLDMPFNITKETLLITAEEEKFKALKIAEVMDKLSARQREIIYLRFYHNMSYEEISDVMQINYQVCRNLLSQAIKSLRKLLPSL